MATFDEQIQVIPTKMENNNHNNTNVIFSMMMRYFYEFILNPENETLNEEVTKDVRGTVKWFDVKNGFGFIARNDTKEDIFVHHSNIMLKNNCHKRSSLGDREEVEFDVRNSEKGFEAVNVTGPNGQPVIGMKHALKK